jgi:hypothetical protein
MSDLGRRAGSEERRGWGLKVEGVPSERFATISWILDGCLMFMLMAKMRLACCLLLVLLVF